MTFYTVYECWPERRGGCWLVLVMVCSVAVHKEMEEEEKKEEEEKDTEAR